MILFLIISGSSKSRNIRYSIDGALNSTFQSVHNSEHSSGNNSSFVWDSRLNASLSIKLTKDLLLSNILNLGYGQINIKPGSSNLWSEPMINSDYINLTTSLRSDDCKKSFGFLHLNFKSSFFDQASRIALNPFTLNVAAGGTHTIKKDNFSLSIAGSAGISYKNLKRIVDSTYSEPKIIIDQQCHSNVALDIDFNYILSQHLYLNSKCLISQSFDTPDSYRPEVSWSLSINAPVTSYLNFCYNANMEMSYSPKTAFRFNHSLNAGLYFDIKNK